MKLEERKAERPVLPATPFDWQEQALCAEIGTEMFFPAPRAPATDALRICRACSVSDACLSYALDTNQTEGVWGATTPKQRSQIREARRRQT